ncbi:MAG TPA: alkane 1-monooxygenase [Flavobacteriales bacterium]|nr:alkane 1-monooxygenase [Flavobacteriales bacterium]HMR25853.1 alkane 1-monooxygenase [Flavobacteriales bacterium]
MRPNALKYTLVYLIPGVVAASLAVRNAWSFAAVAFVFGVMPVIELFLKPDPRNLDAVQEAVARQGRGYDRILYSLVPIQWGLLLFFLVQVSAADLSWPVKLGLTSAFGMACGVLGINAAHELGHRPTKHEQFMAKALLLTTLYMHFFIEHNRGHHKHVSTNEDPASSRRGEWLYAFFVRTITGSWLSAWKLEQQRLRKKGLPVWSWHNEMLHFQVVQLVLVALIAAVFGLEVMGWFLGAALIGILLLETVNYIEHYGLRRKKNGDNYERPLPIHSWNSDHPLGRLILLELTRHSDHHYLASRKYQVLRHFDQSPQLPAGYPAMMALAFFPPLWFRVMDREIDRLKERPGREVLA